MKEIIQNFVSLPCPACQSTEFSLEVDTASKVCAQCGNVLEESMVRSELEFEEGHSSCLGQFVPHHDSIYVHERTCDSIPNTTTTTITLPTPSTPRTTFLHEGVCLHGKHQGRKAKWMGYTKIGQVLNKFGMRGYMEQVKMLYAKAMDHSEWRYGKNKDLVIGSCVYLIARQHQKPLGLMDIAAVLGYQVFDVGRVYRKLKEFFGMYELPELEPEVLVERICGLGKKTSPRTTATTTTTTLSWEEGRNESLIDGSKLILRMAKQAWLTVGRQPEALAGAAVLLMMDTHAYSIYTLSRERKKFHNERVKEIATTLNTSYLTVEQRYNELEKMLLSWAMKHLPWKDGIKESDSVSKFMEDILEYAVIDQSEDHHPINSIKDLPRPPSYVKAEEDAETRHLLIDKAKIRLNMMNTMDCWNTSDHKDLRLLLVEKMLLLGLSDERISRMSWNEIEEIASIKIPSTQQQVEQELSAYVRSPEEVQFLGTLQEKWVK